MKGYMMQLQISIKEDKAELFLQILKEFKGSMVEKIKILDSEEVSDEENQEIQQMLDDRTLQEKEVSHSKILTIDI
jgi:hypothetical protein